MTQTESEVLDNLYFISSFKELKASVHMDEMKLKAVLEKLIIKEWVSVYADPEEDPLSGLGDFGIHYGNYFYLSTRKGMLAHHGIV